MNDEIACVFFIIKYLSAYLIAVPVILCVFVHHKISEIPRFTDTTCPAVEDAGAPKVVAGRYSSRVPLLVHNCNCNGSRPPRSSLRFLLRRTAYPIQIAVARVRVGGGRNCMKQGPDDRHVVA